MKEGNILQIIILFISTFIYDIRKAPSVIINPITHCRTESNALSSLKNIQGLLTRNSSSFQNNLSTSSIYQSKIFKNRQNSSSLLFGGNNYTSLKTLKFDQYLNRNDQNFQNKTKKLSEHDLDKLKMKLNTHENHKKLITSHSNSYQTTVNSNPKSTTNIRQIRKRSPSGYAFSKSPGRDVKSKVIKTDNVPSICYYQPNYSHIIAKNKSCNG
jgi:hypothetical protein